MIIVLAGPGGVGKGTIARRLVQLDPHLRLSKSWTTRARRVDDAAEAYVFVDRATFESAVLAGGFLEHAEFLGNLYGTPMPRVEEFPPDDDLLLEIEVQGAAQVMQIDPSALLIFVAPPSPEEQERRLRGRGDPEDRVAERLAKTAQETAAARALGAIEVVNDDLDRAVAEVLDIIRRARAAP